MKTIHGRVLHLFLPILPPSDSMFAAAMVLFARNVSLVGSGKGSGVGIHVSGNGFQFYGVQADSFGGDGIEIDGVRSNTNNFLLERVRSHKNGGRGFFTLSDAIQTWACGYRHLPRLTPARNIVSRILRDISSQHSPPKRKKTPQVFPFVSSSENHCGSAYLEPAAPTDYCSCNSGCY